MRFINPQGFSTGDDFFTYLRDSFDFLYSEGETRAENDVGRAALPPRRPARPRRGAQRFLDYVGGFDRVWIASRLDIAHHWYREHRSRCGRQPA